MNITLSLAVEHFASWIFWGSFEGMAFKLNEELRGWHSCRWTKRPDPAVAEFVHSQECDFLTSLSTGLLLLRMQVEVRIAGTGKTEASQKRGQG